MSLIEQGVPNRLLGSTLAAVTGQRLVRVICKICCQPAEPPAAQTLAAHGISPEDAATLRFFKGKGCPSCNTVGYRGRRAVFEVLPGTPEVRHAIEEGLPIVRAANTGISAVIDPVGRITGQLGLGTDGVLDATLPAAADPTFYSRAGDIPAALLVALALASAFRRRKSVAGS